MHFANKCFSNFDQNYENEDISAIKNNILNMLTNELEFKAVGIFNVNGDFIENATISGSTSLIKKAGNILGSPLQKLRFNLKESDNIFAKSVKERTYHITSDVEEFLPKIPIPRNIIKNALQSLMNIYNVKNLVILPCFYKNELYSCIIVGNDTQFTETQITILRFASAQLATCLRFANITSCLKNENVKLENNLVVDQKALNSLNHNLRTPISIIEISTSLLELEIDKNKNISNDILKHQTDRIKIEIKRLIKILEITLLNIELKNNEQNPK
jgi:K+-sensing histidine kinase KdpD